MIRGRFAPTPSGRMHLGNLFAAMLAWLDVRSAGGIMVLRIEDLDPRRCSAEHAKRMMDDLYWLGLDWDEGGLEADFCQSQRGGHYQKAFQKLEESNLVYPCYCSRAERLAASAPHRDDGAAVYSGKCRTLTAADCAALEAEGRHPAWRIKAPDLEVSLEDGNCGRYTEYLARDCGDFILRRSDGVYAYQLAVVVDDAAMGINHVVRGRDLLSSSPRQIWLHRQLGAEPPRFFHTPLLLAADGRRLAKRDQDLDMGALRTRYTAEELTGILAWWAGLLERPEKVPVHDLIEGFTWAKVPKKDITVQLP